MAKKISKQDRSFVRTAMDFERKYDFDKSFSEAMNLAEQAKRQADEAYSVATNIKGIFFFIRYSAYADGTNMTEEPQADTVYMGTCSTNVDEAPTDKSAYTWTKILGNDGAKGEDGETGVGVSDMKAQYCISSNKTTPPTSGWKDTMDAWSKGTYLWIRHIITYTNGDVVATYPFCDSSWEAVNELDSKIDCEEIFLRLSKGNQGVYRDEQGRYYISAELVKAGIIKSKDGENVVIDLDNGDVKLTGTIQTNVTADKDEYGLSRQATFRPELISMSEKRENDDGSSNRCQTWIMPGSVYMYDSYYDANGSLTKRETIGFDLYNKRLRGLADPNINSDGSDAVNKRYVDNGLKSLSCKATIDLRGYDESIWYPVDTFIENLGLLKIHVHSRLYDGDIPSWCLHSSGFYADFVMLVEHSGWGESNCRGICLHHDYKFADTNPIGYTQLGNASRAVLYLRGGGIYYVDTDWNCEWAIRTSDLTASDQTASLKTSYPGVTGYAKANIYANLVGNLTGDLVVDNTFGLVTALHCTGTDAAYGYFKTGSGINRGSFGYYNGMTYIGNEYGNCARIGVNTGGVPQYWSSYDPSTAKDLLHTGNTDGHIVAQGTSGGWEYRLWSNGFTELWKQTTPVPCSVSSAWGNVYVQDNAISSSAYPVTFVSYPHVVASVFSVDGNQYVSGDYFLFTGAIGSTTASPHFGVMRPKAPSANISLSAQLYVCGYRVT